MPLEKHQGQTAVKFASTWSPQAQVMSAEQDADRPASSEVPTELMCLTTDKVARYWIVSNLVAFVACSSIVIGVCALGRDSNLQLAGIVAGFFGILFLIKTILNLSFGHLNPRFRKSPLLTVTGKFVEFDIPQLFLAQFNSVNRIGALLGFKQPPLRRPLVTLVSACYWEVASHKRRLFVTTKLPVWGPLKIRMRTEWYVPEFAVDQWVNFVAKVNEAAMN